MDVLKDFLRWLFSSLLGFLGGIGGVFIRLTPEEVVGLSFLSVSIYGIYIMFFSEKNRHEKFSAIASGLIAFFGSLVGASLKGAA